MQKCGRNLMCNGSKAMSARVTAAERRAFNDGLQAALLVILVICVEKAEDSPLCPHADNDVCLGCPNLPKKQKQMFARIKVLKEGA